MSVHYKLSGNIARITMDDGKVNAFSSDMFRLLNEALDQVESDRAVPILGGREGIFSAGYHLGELAASTASAQGLLQLGAGLCCRLLDFPYPVVAACSGHAYPMGAFVLMCSDYRIGADGPFNIGLNEVRIGISVPRFALQIARGRLHPSWFNRTAITGELFSPADSVQAGFLDQVVAASELEVLAAARAEELAGIDFDRHRETKQRLRATWIAAIEQGLQEDVEISGV